MNKIELDERIESIDDARSILDKILPKYKYHDLEPFEGDEGHQRRCFKASWGESSDPKKVRKAFIKVDKKPDGKNAYLLRSRGCNTLNDVHALSELPVDEAISNHISPLIDYYMDGDTIVSIEPEFEGSKSLRKLVDEKGSLDKQQFQEVFSNVLSAMHYLIKEKRMFHRDLHPSNILVRQGCKGLEARITDLANATKTEDIEPKALPTAGAKFIRDPLLGSAFTGRYSQYDERTEMYSIGINALVALTGDSPFRYSYTGGEAANSYNGESFIGHDGKMDWKKHDVALRQALEKIPSSSKKHSRWIERCLSSDAEKRYSSIDDLVSDFRKACEPGLLGKIIRHGKILIPAALIAFSAFGGFLNHVRKKNVEEVRNASAYKVVSRFNRDNSSISNNLFDLQVSAYDSSTAGEGMNIYRSENPEYNAISGKPGDKLRIHVQGQLLPREFNEPFSIGRFHGRTYIEGFSVRGNTSSELEIEPIDWNNLCGEGWMGASAYIAEKEITLPKGVPPGTYSLAVEIYSPGRSLINKTEGNKRTTLRFMNPNKILSRIRIPIILGKPSNAVGINSINVDDYSSSMGDVDIYLTIKEARKYPGFQGHVGAKSDIDISIPEEEYVYTRKSSFSSIGLPSPKVPGIKTLQIIPLDKNNKPIGYTAFPVEVKSYGPESNMRSWKVPNVGREFGEKLAEYRESAFKRLSK